MKTIAIISLGLLVSGCATITRGRNEEFKIDTEPPGAEAQLSTGQTCITPCVLTLPRKSEFTVKLKKEGYKEVTASVTNEISGAGAAGFVGNAIIGGLIGAGVDAATGATLNLKPNPLALQLEPETPAIAETSPAETPPPAASSEAPPVISPPPAAAPAAPEASEPEGSPPSEPGDQPSGGAGV